MEIVTYIFMILSFAYVVLGSIVLIKHKAALTLDFNWRNVKEEDINEYTTAFGIAYIIFGCFMFLLTLLRILYGGVYKDEGFVLFFIGFIITMIIIIRTQIKFKTGLFNS